MLPYWYSYPEYLRCRYGKVVYRVGVDAGFSCPNREENRMGGCAFCDGAGAVAVYQRKGEGHFNRGSAVALSGLDLRLSSIKEQVEQGKAFLIRRYKAEGFALYLQAMSNTYAPLDVLERIYTSSLALAPFCAFIVATRPDLLSDEVCALLSSYKREEMDVWVEVGLESANDRTLTAIGRNHTLKDYQNASERVHRHGLKLCTHAMAGLPGEGMKEFVETAVAIAETDAEAVKLHNTQVLLGTPLLQMYQAGEFSVLDAKTYITYASAFLAHTRKGVIIERLLSESPSHRLVAPRDYPDKRDFLCGLEHFMMQNGLYQGCAI